MMSKTRIFALSVIVLILTAVFTNPRQEELEGAVKKKAAEILKQESGKRNQDIIEFGMQLIGNTLVDQFIQTQVEVENYYLFSLLKIRWDSKETIIGGGAFKYVWLNPKLNEKASEVADKIKNL